MCVEMRNFASYCTEAVYTPSLQKHKFPSFEGFDSMKRAKNAAYNYNSVCKIALNILKNDDFDHGKKKPSIRRKMLKAVLDEKYWTKNQDLVFQTGDGHH